MNEKERFSIGVNLIDWMANPLHQRSTSPSGIDLRSEVNVIKPHSLKQQE